MIQRITRRTAFNEKLKRYVDLKTKKIISKREAQRRIKISNRLKGRLRKIYRNTMGMVIYIQGVKHDLKVQLITRRKVNIAWAKRKMFRELMEWWREEFEGIASKPYDYEVLSGRKIRGKPTSDYITRKMGVEENELIDKNELPKGFRWEKGKVMYVLRIFDDAYQKERTKGVEKNQVSLDAWLD